MRRQENETVEENALMVTRWPRAPEFVAHKNA